MKNKLFLTVLMLMLFSITGVQAATITVTSLDDTIFPTGDCTLREAVDAARRDIVIDSCTAGSIGTDDIIFANGLTGTISLLETLFIFNSDINITGTGITLDGGNKLQILNLRNTNSTVTGLSLINARGGAVFVSTGVTLALNSCVISNNSTDTVVSTFYINDGASVTIENCLFENNTTTGATKNYGGAIHNNGQLTIRQSTFRLNHSSGNGGAIYNHDSGNLAIYNSAILNNISDRSSGGVDSRGKMFISESRFEGNHALSSSAIYSFTSLPVTIEQTNISNNTSSGSSFAVKFLGTLTLRDSTISGNIAQDVGATMGGILVTGDASIINSTISGNNGPGILISAGTSTPLPHASLTNVTITNNGTNGVINYKNFDSVNSIIANNGSADCWSSINVTSNGGNINGDSSCGFTQTTDQTNIDPSLEKLKGNRGIRVGPTSNLIAVPTHALWVTSPAVDLGNDVSCPTTDQRGISRPIDGDSVGGAVCDIGAYELRYQPQITITDSLAPNDDLLLPFNSQRTGTNTEAIITISNLGAADLTVRASSLTSIPVDFSVNLSGGTNPCGLENTLTLLSTESCTISVTFNPASTGDHSGSFVLATNDPDSPEDNKFAIRMSGKGVEPDIAVSPAALSFSAVEANTSSSQSVTVTNNGDFDLNISTVTISGTKAANFSADLTSGTTPCGATPVTVAPAASCDFLVQFSPDTSGKFSAVITVTTDDPDTVDSTVSLYGEATEPEIDVTDSLGISNDLSLPFGELAIGKSVEYIVTINNVNSTFASNLNVSAIQITGTDVSDFALDINAGSTPCGATTTTIIPGNSCTVGISFTPQTEGVKSATLVINSDDLNEATVSLTLSATGTTPPVAAAGGGGGCTLKSGAPAPFDPLWPFMFIVAAFYQVRKYALSKQEN